MVTQKGAKEKTEAARNNAALFDFLMAGGLDGRRHRVADVMKATGLSRSYLNHIRQGEIENLGTEPSIRLARYFGVPWVLFHGYPVDLDPTFLLFKASVEQMTGHSILTPDERIAVEERSRETEASLQRYRQEELKRNEEHRRRVEEERPMLEAQRAEQEKAYAEMALLMKNWEARPDRKPNENFRDWLVKLLRARPIAMSPTYETMSTAVTGAARFQFRERQKGDPLARLDDYIKE